MKKYIHIVLLLAVISLWSCQKEIDFSGNEGKEYLVVMGNMMPDSVAVVNLSYSRFFLSKEATRYVNDAQMKLWVNGTEYAPISVESGNYTFGVTTRSGDSVWFEAEVAGYGVISGATKVITYPVVDNVTIEKAQDYTFWRMMDVQYVRFNISDPSGEEDFYGLQIIEHDQRPAHDTAKAIDTVYFAPYMYMGFSNVGDTLKGSPFESQMGVNFVQSDEKFDGEQRAFTLLAAPMIDTLNLTTRKYWVRVTAYNRPMLKYILSAQKASSEFAMFAEPMQVYSNIKGDAIGIFASKVSRVIKANKLDK